MTMKEKIIARREAEKMKNTVEVLYADGATGTTTVDKILKEDAAPVLPYEFDTVMTRLFATNYAIRVIAEVEIQTPVFGFLKIYTSYIDDLNDALEVAGIDKVDISKNDNNLYTLIEASRITTIKRKINETRHILRDVVTDVYGDVLGIGFSKVGKYYVPIYQIVNIVNPMDCILKNGNIEIEIDINPAYMIDLDKENFVNNVCSLKQAIENIVAYELFDDEHD